MERSYTVRELHEMSGIPLAALYRAIGAGALRAFTLDGAEQGKRVWESEWRRYAADELGLPAGGPEPGLGEFLAELSGLVDGWLARNGGAR